MWTFIHAHPFLVLAGTVYLLLVTACIHDSWQHDIKIIFERPWRQQTERDHILVITFIFMDLLVHPWTHLFSILFFVLPQCLVRIGIPQKVGNIIVHTPLFASMNYYQWVTANYLMGYAPTELETHTIAIFASLASLWWNVISELILFKE